MAEASDRRRKFNDKTRRTPSVEELILDILKKKAIVADPVMVEAVHRTTCLAGGVHLRVPPGMPAIAPGDQILHDGRTVTDLLPRQTVLTRRDPMNSRDLVIAANVDVIVVVVSCVNPPLHPRLIDRYLAAIWRGGAAPAIVLNKIDLHDDKGRATDRALLNPYRELGIPIFEVSTVESAGIAALRDHLATKLSAFVGHSGVGKSSLVNALFPTVQQRIGGVDGRGKGTHTTTSSSLHRAGDMCIVDTPGVRAFAVEFGNPGEVAESFPEFPTPCQYRGCTHLREEGCAVLKALAEKRISSARYDSYRRLLEDAFPELAQPPDSNGFSCRECGCQVGSGAAGTSHRNHCPQCLRSVHLDNVPGDRLSGCQGVMEPVAVWVRRGGEWAVIHRCRKCGHFASNRIAADDNEMLLLSLAVKPLSLPPFPLERLAVSQSSSPE
jgi:ribosome biogenesis GTPase